MIVAVQGLLIAAAFVASCWIVVRCIERSWDREFEKRRMKRLEGGSNDG